MTFIISIYNPYTSIQLFLNDAAYQISLHRWHGFEIKDEVAETKMTLGFISWGIRDI
jgi:hypothetical protein